MNINVSDFDLVRRLISAGGHCKVEMIMYHLLSTIDLHFLPKCLAIDVFTFSLPTV